MTAGFILKDSFCANPLQGTELGRYMQPARVFSTETTNGFGERKLNIVTACRQIKKKLYKLKLNMQNPNETKALQVN